MGKNMMAYVGNVRRVLIIVENLPVPFDRRVWQEAKTLRDSGYEVSVICPKGSGYEKKVERLEGVDIYRHRLFEARGAAGYLLEYGSALFWQFVLAWKVLLFGRGFDVIHACNPPDTIFLIGFFFKLFGKEFLFDHHDINPELYEAKFGRKDFLYRMLLRLERWTYRTADVSIATNESYKQIAIERGGMEAERVFIVRSGPDLGKLRIGEGNTKWKKGRRFMVGYVGVMSKQEGIDHLLRAVRYIVRELGKDDVQFVIVGSGPEVELVREYASEIGVDEYVTFTGRVADAELLEVLNTADICVNPDVANDMNDKSTMNKIMEYMALGKAMVQYDLREGRYSEQGASLYARRNDEVDFARKIVELLDDERLRIEMGRLGRERVENELQWPYQVPVLLRAYERLWQGQQCGGEEEQVDIVLENVGSEIDRGAAE